MNKVLICIETHFEKELITLRKIFVKLSQKMKIEKISSVYELNEPYSYGISVCIVICTEDDNKNTFFQRFKNIMESVNSPVFSYHILLWEDHVHRSSEITIPHPEFHKNLRWLLPAAEIWKTPDHPILEESLQALLNQFTDTKGITFFKQNKTLLDFLKKEQ